ncbi:MAG TPA: CinA family nicotinamide mononucleotide deamidase-related protein [Terrimicrobiaceae bacterium]|nr:CinA family nicotinamide mononucleotide deamidase-related protein [Terrimicrobiaceae bacterium]
MNLEVLNTGTELLLGTVTNSHLAYFGQELFPLGLRIERQSTIPDGAAIRGALIDAFSRCDILLVTGGLGPTSDDITREITAELLGLRLQLDEAVGNAIRERLSRRNIPVRERMLRQAMVPEGATVLPNAHGTAPGLYIPPAVTPSLSTPHLFLLPGPPRELKPMFANHVLPLLQRIRGDLPDREFRNYHIVGMGESAVEELIGMELSLRGDIEVGYCARPNEVDFRLIAPGPILDEVEPKVLGTLGAHLVSTSGDQIEEVVVKRLTDLQKTLALAESCTGGLLANRITNVPGASLVLLGGFVTYSNDSKISCAGVPHDLLAAHGAVSKPVAEAMAEGAAEKTGADFGIGITGIAGPTGGTPDKPAGTVFIAVSERGAETECRKEFFPSDRETFKQLASQAALDMLRLRIAGDRAASRQVLAPTA